MSLLPWIAAAAAAAAYAYTRQKAPVGAGTGTTGGGTPADTKPADAKPAEDAPPAGPATDDELAAVKYAIANKVKSIAPTIVAAGKGDRRPDQDDQRYYTDWAYWTVYRDPNGDWRSDGHVAAPVTIPSTKSAWVPIYERIGAAVKAQLPKAPPADNPPADNPNKQPDDNTPPPQNPLGDFPPAGGLTTIERTWADLTLDAKPTTANVPAPYNKRKQGESDDNWYATAAYYKIYVDPTSDWVKDGHDAGPLAILDKDSPWATAWARIHDRIVQKMAYDKPGAKPYAPPGPITALEKDAADFVAIARPTVIYGDVVAPPFDKKGADEDWLPWLTKYVWWSQYRSPTSDWVVKGNAKAPIKISLPKDQGWVASYQRIYAYLNSNGV